MNIEATLSQAVKKAVSELYGAEITDNQVQLSKTKKEFEGHLTLVVFPFLKISKKSPEMTANEIGEYLKANEPTIGAFNVIKGFLNLSISNNVWVDMINHISEDKNFGIKEADENSPLVMIDRKSVV